ncbi:GAF domain-containing protein [Nostoc sp. CCY0012]|uniref:GAF domain-containing protein n=1 Tax=Nostoc sp. CCY0012 TaxID=1056123 RepID=UPI0039C6B53A
MTETSPKPIATTTPLPANEGERLEALRRYNILDTPAEVAFDRITSLAARLFNMPMALVSLVDESRGWFKSSYGIDLREVQRDATICSLTLLSNEVLVIPDTRQDNRLACNPFGQNEPGLRFYAGAPLLTPDGFNLGALCLLDTQPHDGLTNEQKAALADFAAMVMDELELRLVASKIAQIDAALLEVTQGVSAVTGEAFFLALVEHLSQVLGVDYSYIGLVDADQQEAIRTIAACGHGQIIDNFEYLLHDTPCREVLQTKKLCCYPHRVQTLFPNAPLLKPLKVESYVALPFFDTTGVPIGLLGVMDSKALTNVQLAESLLTIFALRIATELERQQTETARQQAQQELERLVAQRTAELSQANELLHLEIAERQQAEADLETEQELLKVLLDNVQAGIVACNAEGILTLFNRAARKFHGLPEQPLPPDEWAEYYDLYLPDGTTLMPKHEIPLFRALQGEIVENVEMVISPTQGKAKTLLASGQSIVDSQGKKQGAVVVMHDITERKQAEAERAELIRQQVHEQTARIKAEADQQLSAFLAEVSTVLASSLDDECTLKSVANLVVPFFADWCTIDLLEDNQSIHRVAVAHCDPTKVALGWEIHRRYPRHIDETEGLPKVLRTGKTEIVSEIPDAVLEMVAQDSEHLQILRELGLKSGVISPLIARGQILGAITFVTAESHRRYSPADVSLAEDIAHQAAIAIDNARLYLEAQQSQQAAEESAERITRLQSVTAAFSESLTPIQVADVIVDQGIAALGANYALVALVNDRGTELEVVRNVGCKLEQLNGSQRFSLDAPVPLAEAVRTGQPIWAESSQKRAMRYPHLREQYQQYNFEVWISIPLMVEGRAIGGISFGFMEPQQLDREQQVFILSLTQQCAQAIIRTRLYEAERTARNAAETANRVKDEFLAVLSHELRSPLNPILGWSRLLQNGKLDQAKTAQALATIERNAKLQSELIEDLLDISRILQGKLSLNVSPVNLASTIQAALETVRLAAEAKSITIETSLASQVKLVLGDSTRLQQVMWNLLANAVKFTPAGGKVEVRLEQIDYHAQITIGDNGKGIASDFLPYIFDYFRQADSTTTRKFGGLGLGLAIVHHLVELHGGTVEADSPGEGLGVTFTVRLPLQPISSAANQKEQFSQSSVNLQGVQVLVVDDDTDTRELIVFLLEQAEASVISVTSASAALAALTQSPPDILISDIGMPDMDGYMLIRQVRALPPEQGGQIPAIALTAYAGDFNEKQALAAGFQRHVAKPVEPNELINAIVTLLMEQ